MEKITHIISILTTNELVVLLCFSAILLIFELKYSLSNNKSFRSELLIDFFLWLLLIDRFFLPATEEKIEPTLMIFYQQFIPILSKNNYSITHLNPYLQFAIIFLVLELINYAYHRFVKHNRYLWHLHKIHHQSKYLNQFTDAKNHP